jgi:uncharacterized membrane protein
MSWMDRFRRKELKDYLTAEEQAQIVEAIRQAELRTSGEFRIHMERRCSGDPLVRAQKVFHRMGMHKTEEHNAVLIYLALDSHKFALYGDSAIHSRTGNDFWVGLAAQVKERIQTTQRLSAGLCLAVETIGTQFALHFPRKENDRNEIPDEISFNAN